MTIPIHQVCLSISRECEDRRFTVARELHKVSEIINSLCKITEERCKLLANLMGDKLKKQDTSLEQILGLKYVIPCEGNINHWTVHVILTLSK
jgi:hypothetical protein